MSRHVVIVGAGSAGGVLAGRLSEDPDVSVLLLEAGPDYPSVEQMPEDIRSAWTFGGMDHDWGYESAGVVATRRPSRASASRPRASCPFRAARSSAAPRPSTAAMRCAPTAATSTAGSAWATTTGRGRRSCPYFRRAEDDAAGGDWHGTAARCRSAASPARACARSCARSWTGARRPVTRSSRISTRRVPWERGRCPSTRSMAYGRAPRSRTSRRPAGAPTSRSGPGVTVDRVELIGGRARAVVLTSGERIDADVIVLAAGAIGSPTILQRSGIGPAGQLERLGIALVHHLEGVGSQPARPPDALSDVDDGCRRRRGADASAAGVLACSASGAHVQDQIDLNFVPFTLQPGAILVGMGLVRPYSIGHLELAAADPDVAPRDHLNLFDHPEDLQRTLTGVKLLREIFAQDRPRTATSATSCGPAPTPSATRPRGRHPGTPTTYAHVSARARWGRPAPTGRSSISAARCTALEGLHVVDASIMPTIPAVPTNMTMIMMAERCADALRASLAATAAAPAVAAPDDA